MKYQLENSIARVLALFEQAGIQSGDNIILHCGLPSWVQRKTEFEFQFKYGQRFLNLLTETVGERGTIMMNTDSIADLFRFSYQENVFDYRKSRSRRGLISEIFRMNKGATRSVHPWTNATAMGPMAKDLINSHEKSFPFSMDQNSPWYKASMANFKILYFCVLPFNAFLTTCITEDLALKDNKIAAHWDKGLKIKYLNYRNAPCEGIVNPHTHRWNKNEQVAVYRFLQKNFELHTRYGNREEYLFAASSKHQFDCILNQTLNGRPLVDIKYWGM